MTAEKKRDNLSENNNKKSDEIRVDAAAIRRGDVPARWFRTVPRDDGDFENNVNAIKSGAAARYDWTQPFGNATGSDAYSFQTTQNLTKTPILPDVVCELCARRCRIAPGKVGFCSARINVDGKLRARFYGRPVSTAIDPIEKKPLYHFLPGTPILSLGTFGCNLSCRFCQNWQISRGLPIGENIRNILTPEEVVAAAVARNCPSVAFTYNEPAIWAEYVVDVAKLCRQAGIKTVAVTNGTIAGRAREEFFDAVDATNVDLKAFSPEFYRDLTGGSLDAVKETLRYIAKNTQTWLEVTTLLIPTKNDAPDELARLADWLVDALGADVPLHFSAFFPASRLNDLPPTPPETLVAAEKIARKSGVRFVYRGNVDDDSGQTTRCPNCDASLILRSRYSTRILPTLTKTPKNDASRRFCGNCGAEIVGVFE